MSLDDQLQLLIAHYQKALLIKPNSATIYRKIGNLYHSCFNYEQAVFYYLKAIQLQSDLFPVYHQLRFALQMLSRSNSEQNHELLESGVEILQQNIKTQPHFPFAYFVLGSFLAHLGQIEAAIDCNQKASFQQLSNSHPQLVQSAWNPAQKRSPDFLVLGFIKCGTTSIYGYLSTHPQILPAVTKELHYFTLSPVQDIDYYLSHFPAISDRNYLTGEATPTYINSPSTAKKVRSLFPDIKLIILLRNPVEHTLSSYYQSRRLVPEDVQKYLAPIHFDFSQVQHITGEFLELFDLAKNDSDSLLIKLMRMHRDRSNLSSIVNMSLYIHFIKHWLAVFPREQFLILKSEDLFANPSATMKQVYDFLNLPDHPLPEYRNYNPNSYPGLNPVLRQQLADFFRPYNQELEDYLGMKFNWE
jgi:tetratricopeptide (TPR) repeat protein